MQPSGAVLKDGGVRRLLHEQGVLGDACRHADMHICIQINKSVNMYIYIYICIHTLLLIVTFII